MRLLPIEVLFKAKSEKRTRSLHIDKDLNMSVQWQERGSYRTENIIRYLAKWLDPWTEARAAGQDYRILMMDVAGCHVSDAVEDFAWGRGYIVLLHYGCITGVTQVNDTDLHSHFERIFLEEEQTSFNEKQLLRPGCIARSPQEVLDDIASTWRQCNHQLAVKGHKHTFLSCALDGSEDNMVSREALNCWIALDMPAVRRSIIEEVGGFVASGKATMASWRGLIQHPVDPGVMTREGEEFEGVLEGPAWADNEYDALVAADDVDTAAAEAKAEAPVVQALPGDSPAAVEEADAAAKRMILLKRLRAEAKMAAAPGAYFSLDNELHQMQRGRHAKSPKVQESQAILRRHVLQKSAEAREDLDKRRAAARETDKAAREVKDALAAVKLAKSKEVEARKELKNKLDSLPKIYTSKMLSAEGVAGTKVRRECLDRLKLRSPPLSFANEARWREVRDEYIRRSEKMNKKGTVGPYLTARIKACITGLGCHWGGGGKGKAKPVEGDPAAFNVFFKTMVDFVPKAATSVEM